jgi:hypothetical protein
VGFAPTWNLTLCSAEGHCKHWDFGTTVLNSFEETAGTFGDVDGCRGQSNTFGDGCRGLKSNQIPQFEHFEV